MNTFNKSRLKKYLLYLKSCLVFENIQNIINYINFIILNVVITQVFIYIIT